MHLGIKVYKMVSDADPRSYFEGETQIAVLTVEAIASLPLCLQLMFVLIWYSGITLSCGGLGPLYH